MKSGCLFNLLILGAFVSSVAAWSMQDSPVISESFTVSASTVEVVVTDKDGNRVEKLGKDDFQLLVDDKQVPITFFTEVRDIQQGSGADSSADELPHHVMPTETVPRNYMVFIDDWFTQRKYRARMFKYLTQSVAQLRDEDSMCILRYKGKELEVIIPWSNDKDDLIAAFNEVAGTKSGEMARTARLESMVRPEDRARELQRQIGVTVESVEIAMRSLPAPYGRKNLLLVSQGWPYSFRKAFSFSQRLLEKDGGTWILRPITDTANMLGYTVYPMLLGKLEAGDLGSREAPTYAQFSQDTEFEVNHDGLSFIAEETGGELVNKVQSNKHPLDDVAADQRGYYTLGFISSEFERGVRHNMEVRVGDETLTVRHRGAFRPRTLAEQGNIMAQAALLSGLAENNLTVTLGTPQKHKRGQVNVPFSIEIPLDWASLEPVGSERFQLRMTLRVAAEDAGGYRADVAQAPIDIAGGRPKQGAVTQFDASMLIRKKEQRLVFTLQDEIGGKTLSRTIDFKP